MFKVDKISSFVFAFLSIILLSSCANWSTRRECDRINWYEHGHQIAMSGKRLTGDPQIERCRKAGFDLPEQQMDLGFKAGMSQYCKPDIVYSTGREGNFFNTDLCDPGQMKELRQKHEEGVRAYCDKNNARQAGLSGKKYQNICPPELEREFLPEYLRGRHQFFSQRLTQLRRDEMNIERKQLSLERDKAHLTTRLALLPPAREVKEKFQDSNSGEWKERLVVQDPAAQQRRRYLDDLKTIDGSLRQENLRIDKIRADISEVEKELATLGQP